MAEWPYPKAAAWLAEACADERLLWMGAAKLRHVASFFVILGGISLIILLAAALLDMPWAAAGLFIAGGLLLLVSLAATWAVMGTCYAITDHHVWVLAKSGRGMVMDCPLENLRKIRIHNLNSAGTGDLELCFNQPGSNGKMHKRSLMFTAVPRVVDMERIVLSHLADAQENKRNA